MTEIVAKFALGTFRGEQEAFSGLVIDEVVYPIRFPDGPRAAGGTPSTLEIFDDWDVWWPALSNLAEHAAAGRLEGAHSLDSLQILAPIAPRQIICSGANYRKHVVDIMVDHEAASDTRLSLAERRIQAEKIMDHRAKAGQPFAFIKPYSTLLAPFDNLLVPPDCDQLDWELELGVVIGKPARRVRREEAFSYVAGYVITNDISARDHIVRPDFPTLGMDWVACKSGPGFLPIGPFIVPSAFVPDPQNLMISLKLNGQIMQRESTADMIFPIDRLIEYLSVQMQLLPGDVICTGSPSGNGTHYGRFLRPGDVLEGSIEGLGTQRNHCAAEKLADGAVLHQPFVPLAAS